MSKILGDRLYGNYFSYIRLDIGKVDESLRQGMQMFLPFFVTRELLDHVKHNVQGRGYSGTGTVVSRISVALRKDAINE